MGDFTSKTRIEDALARSPLVGMALWRMGIRCFFCAGAAVEDFAEGARLHPFDLKKVLKALNALELPPPDSTGETGKT